MDAAGFAQIIRARNRREHAACASIVAGFGCVAVLANDPWWRAGSAAVAAGALYVAWVLATRGAPSERAPLATEVRRQRDLLRSVWRWYLGPFVPGLALLVAASDHTAVAAAAVAGMFVAIFALNRRAARDLDAWLSA